MNTTYRTISALFLAVFFTFTPNLASAQVVSEPVTIADIQAAIDALQFQLKIQMLMDQIASLTAQINQILANQSAQATQLGAVQTQVNEVVEQVTPVVAPAPTITFSFSSPVCYPSSAAYSTDNPVSSYDKTAKVVFSVGGGVDNVVALRHVYRASALQNNMSTIYVSEGLKAVSNTFSSNAGDLTYVVPGSYPLTLNANKNGQLVGSTSTTLVIPSCN